MTDQDHQPLLTKEPIMCYLVTYFNPPSSTTINVIQTEVCEDFTSARVQAEDHLLAGATDVQVWKLAARPSIQKTVAWAELPSDKL